jgi:hypothetical protein
MGNSQKSDKRQESEQIVSEERQESEQQGVSGESNQIVPAQQPIMACRLLKISDDILCYLLEFNQRTDRLALKLSSKRFYNNPRLPNYSDEKEIYDELMMYILDVDHLDYSWKDSPHCRVRVYGEASQWNIHRRFIQTHNLWWFHFFGFFQNVYPGDYIFCFYTTVKRFEIRIQLFRNNENAHFSAFTFQKTVQTNNPLFNVNIPEKCSKVEILCKETNDLKHGETVKFMVLVPAYYFTHLQQFIFPEV